MFLKEIRINICGRPSGWPCSFLLSSLSFSQYLWHLSLPFLPNYFWRSCSAGGREHLPSLRRMKCEMRISLISSTRHRRHPSCSCIWTRDDMISISPLSSPPLPSLDRVICRNDPTWPGENPSQPKQMRNAWVAYIERLTHV